MSDTTKDSHQPLQQTPTDEPTTQSDTERNTGTATLTDLPDTATGTEQSSPSDTRSDSPQQEPADDSAQASATKRGPGASRVRLRRLDLRSPRAGVWIGIGVILLGLLGIFSGWRAVAGVFYVAQQLPPLVSGGIGGLAVVVIGVTVIDVSMRRGDSRERQRQLREMTSVLATLHDLLATDDEPLDRAADPEQRRQVSQQP